jgi:hypothetical protein
LIRAAASTPPFDSFASQQMKVRRLISNPLPLALSIALVTAFVYGAYYFWVYHNNPVVLEIYTDCRGMTYPQGKLLNFRLYQSGRLEYDKYPPQEQSPYSHLRYWFPRTHSYVTPTQVNELIALAEQPDFLGAEREYPAAQMGADSEFRTSVSFRHAGHEKYVVVVDYYGDDGIGATQRYPQSLLALLSAVSTTKRAL